MTSKCIKRINRRRRERGLLNKKEEGRQRKEGKRREERESEGNVKNEDVKVEEGRRRKRT